MDARGKLKKNFFRSLIHIFFNYNKLQQTLSYQHFFKTKYYIIKNEYFSTTTKCSHLILLSIFLTT